MKKVILIAGIIIGFSFGMAAVTYAATVLFVPQGGTGQSSFTSSQLLYGNGTNALSSVATGTISASGGITVTAGRAAVGGAAAFACTAAGTGSTGCLSNTDWNTFNGKESVLTFTWPLIRSANTITFGGLSTSTPAVIGNIPYFSGVNTFANVATTTVTVSSGLGYSGTFGFVIGGVSGNLTCATGSATVFGCLTAANFLTFNNKVGTSSNATAGNLAYYTTTNGTPALIADVATGTLSGSNGITVTASRFVVGGAATVDCTAASVTATGCLTGANFQVFNNKIGTTSAKETAGQILAYGTTNGTPPLAYPVSTSTPVVSSGLAYSGTMGSVIGGTGGNLTCATGSNTVFGCLTAANFLVFNNKVGTSTASETAGQLAYFTTTSGTPALITGVATGTISGTNGITVTALRYAIGGAAAIDCTVSTRTAAGCLSAADFGTFANKIGTSTAKETAGQLGYYTTTSGTPPLMAPISTTTVTCGTGLSCTGFTTIGGSPITITNTGAAFGYPFDSVQTYGTTTAATSTSLWAKQNIYASSTLIVATSTWQALYIDGISGKTGFGGQNTGPTQYTFGAGTNTNVNPNINLLVQGASDARLGVAVGSIGTFMSVGDASTYGGVFAHNYTAGAAINLALNQFGGNVGVGGTTTPYATLSVMPATFAAATPLFAIATSTATMGNVFEVSATSSVRSLSGLFSSVTSAFDSGVRVVIGAFQNYSGLLLDQLNVNGRINTGEWFEAECPGNIGQGTGQTSSVNNFCSNWMYRIDSNGTVTQSGFNTTVPGAFLLRQLVAQTNSGNGFFAAFTSAVSTGALAAATSTPSLETSVSLNNVLTGGTAAPTTTVRVGFVNIDGFGTSFEVAPTAGCYFEASTTEMTWQALCRTSATAVTQVSTSFASTSPIFHRFRVDMDKDKADFYMQTPTSTLVKVASISTNYPSTNRLGAAIYQARLATAGTQTDIAVGYMRLWFRRPLWAL